MLVLGAALSLNGCYSDQELADASRVITALPEEIKGCVFLGDVDTSGALAMMEQARFELKMKASRLGATHLVETFVYPGVLTRSLLGWAFPEEPINVLRARDRLRLMPLRKNNMRSPPTVHFSETRGRFCAEKSYPVRNFCCGQGFLPLSRIPDRLQSPRSKRSALPHISFCALKPRLGGN